MCRSKEDRSEIIAQLRDLIAEYEDRISKDSLGRLVIMLAQEITGRRRINVEKEEYSLKTSIDQDKNLATLELFVSECIDHLRPITVPTAELYEQYLIWSDAKKLRPMNRRLFFITLAPSDLGKRKRTHNDGRLYVFE